MKRDTSYLELFDEEGLDKIVFDVLCEHIKLLLKYGNEYEEGLAKDLLKTLEHFAIPQELEEFLKEIVYET